MAHRRSFSELRARAQPARAGMVGDETRRSRELLSAIFRASASDGVEITREAFPRADVPQGMPARGGII